MKKAPVVFEHITQNDERFVQRLVTRGRSVWVIEPFIAPHHKSEIDSFPSHFPKYVNELVKYGKVSLLPAYIFKPGENILNCPKWAVEIVELIYPLYLKKHKALIQTLCILVGSHEAERSFKSNLASAISAFYSMNQVFQNLEKVFSDKEIYVYPDMNIATYHSIKNLVLKSNQSLYEHHRIRFPIKRRIKDYFKLVFTGIKNIAIILIQICGGIFFTQAYKPKPKREFLLGMAIISPRQLQGKQLSPSFLIDNKKITGKDVVYFPLFQLNESQKIALDKLPGTVFYLPTSSLCFISPLSWINLLIGVLRNRSISIGQEIQIARVVLANYLKWKIILKEVHLKHFVTSADFGYGYLGRNIVMHQARIETWYYTDSINCSYVFDNIDNHEELKHPFWTYLYYNHFVTWDDKIAQFYKRHPDSFEHIHIVGCLRSQQIANNAQTTNTNHILSKNCKNVKFIIAVFDTTYTVNSILSYIEGIAFAEDLFKLVESSDDIGLILKEKKDRSIHKRLDQKNGPKLIDLYDRMSSHPRITVCQNDIDAADVISISDLVVSFPFTSTSFEALSVDRPAIWHDPMGYYKSTPYGSIVGVTTHSYEELEGYVKSLISSKGNKFTNPFSPDSTLMDPFRDGKAIDRFRDLLLTHDK